MYLCKCPSGCPQRAQPAFSVPHTSPLPTGPSLTKTESLGWDNTSEVRGLGKAVLCEVRPETHPDPKLPIVFPADIPRGVQAERIGLLSLSWVFK